VIESAPVTADRQDSCIELNLSRGWTFFPQQRQRRVDALGHRGLNI